MKPRKYCDGLAGVPPAQLTPPPYSQPASSVSEAVALLRNASGLSWYFTMRLSSVWRRLRPGMPSVSVPKYWLPRTENQPFGRQRICMPTPGALLNLPYDCQPLTSHGSILSLSLGKIWMRMPLKNQGVFDETYEGWYVQLSKL
jgi:hypothetical protein